MSWIRSFTSKNAFNQSSFYGWIWTVCKFFPPKSLLSFWSPESHLGRIAGRCGVGTCGVRPRLWPVFYSRQFVDILNCFHHLTSESWTNSPSSSHKAGPGTREPLRQCNQQNNIQNLFSNTTLRSKTLKHNEIWYVKHSNYCQPQWTHCNDDILMTMFPFFNLSAAWQISAPGSVLQRVCELWSLDPVACLTFCTSCPLLADWHRCKTMPTAIGSANTLHPQSRNVWTFPPK